MIDGRRIAVASAYSAACRREGLRHDLTTWVRLCHWGCHRDDADIDEPTVAAVDMREWAARRRVVEETMAAGRDQGGTLPDDVTERMMRWIHDIEI